MCLCEMEGTTCISREPAAPWLSLGPESSAFCISYTPGSARPAHKLGAGGAREPPGTSPPGNKAQQGKRMRVCCFYFIFPFISMPTCVERLGVDKCARAHTHSHYPPFSCLCACRTHTHTRSPVHTGCGHQLSASSVWLTLPLPPTPVLFTQSSPLGKLIIFTPHSLDWPLLELLSL